MKILTSVLMATVLGGFAFGANIADEAQSASKKIFENQKKASALEAQIKELCKDSFEVMAKSTKDLKDEDRKVFVKEFKYQMRQNMATLGKEDAYNDKICKKFMNKPHMMPIQHKPDAHKAPHFSEPKDHKPMPPKSEKK